MLFVLAAFLLPWLGAGRLRGAPPPAALAGRMLVTPGSAGYRAPALSRSSEARPAIARAMAGLARTSVREGDDRLRVEARTAFHRPVTSFVELVFSSEAGEQRQNGIATRTPTRVSVASVASGSPSAADAGR